MTASAPPADVRAASPSAPHPERAGAERAVASFLERFFRFGAEPSVETYLPLFHPDITLFDDGMERPVGYEEIPASITETLALAQGFRMVPERWRGRDGVLFVEARNEATILGTPCRWQSVYRVRLAGDRVIDGRRYYDRAPLLATFDPATPRLPSLAAPGEAADAASAEPLACLERGVTARQLVESCARGWADGDWSAVAAAFRDDGTWYAPGLDGALGRDGVVGYRACFARLLGGAAPRVRAWAGDEALLLVEWRAGVPRPSGSPYVLGMVERFDLGRGPRARGTDLLRRRGTGAGPGLRASLKRRDPVPASWLPDHGVGRAEREQGARSLSPPARAAGAGRRRDGSPPPPSPEAQRPSFTGTAIRSASASTCRSG